MKALTPLLNVQDAARSVSFYCEKLGFGIDMPAIEERIVLHEKIMLATILRAAESDPIQLFMRVQSSPMSGHRSARLWPNKPFQRIAANDAAPAEWQR